MIAVVPPVTPPFVPSTQKVSFVKVSVVGMAPNQSLIVTLLNADKKAIGWDRSAVRRPTPAEMTAALKTVTTGSSEVATDERFLPFIQAVYGLTGTPQDSA